MGRVLLKYIMEIVYKLHTLQCVCVCVCVYVNEYRQYIHCTVPFLLVLLLRILSEDPYHLSILPNKEREEGGEEERERDYK